MKLLLVSLQSNASLIGLKYVAAGARAHGHDARILFLPGYLENGLHPEIEKFVRDYGPDLIGVGLMSIEFYPAKKLTSLLKKKFDVPVIWGGVHAIIRPEECVKCSDYVCIGEGERVIVSLLEHLKIRGRNVPPEIPGIWTNHNGAIIKQPVAQPEKDLDSLPIQEYLPGYLYGFHNNAIYDFSRNQGLFRRYALYGGTCHMMITTRGCPFQCSYCGNSAFMSVYGKKVRERSVSSVMDEIREVIKDPFVLYINFQDDCFFTHSEEWVADFCAQYKKHVGLPFIARVIPTMMSREKLLMLRDAGLCWVVMGIQSGSDRVNFEVYHRRVRFSAVKKAADIISETGAAAFYEMIVDNPYETEEEKVETVRALATLKKPYIVSLAHLTFFPGTPLADKAVKDNIVTPEAYLFRYLLNIDDTYPNKLLAVTPCVPRLLVGYLNRPESMRTGLRALILNTVHFTVKRFIEPSVFLFITTRSLHYRMDRVARTVLGNWRSTLSRLASKYLGKGDLEFGRRLEAARKSMPELFDDRG
ncbi:MAG: B12-binding domain-containing radical SAM protein [Nitrospirae bacterium]|nr:B12-binding domain-containing radical SAM protein [Nitrospirota bacterium]